MSNKFLYLDFEHGTAVKYRVPEVYENGAFTPKLIRGDEFEFNPGDDIDPREIERLRCANDGATVVPHNPNLGDIA